MRNALLGALLLGAYHACGQSDCELTQDREGIKVYTCSSGSDKLKTVRVELLAHNATIAELERIIDKVPDYVNWHYQVIEASVLERKSANEMVYRTRLSTPALIDDREMIVRLKKKKDPTGKRMDISIHTDPFPYPADQKLIRVPESHTTWIVKAVNDKTIHITYTLSMDPGGWLPAFVVNEALTVGPYEMFSKLKKMLE
jgi:hypothetical protein